jgi:deoxyribodipyrimidine photo-lyase
MSSPVTAADSCSRLSPHLAYGTISTRMVVQQLRARIAQTEDALLLRAWRAFDARLHWRDHFMQKLEDEPAIEHHNFVRGFDGLRENGFDAGRFAAWAEGRTGYPMVDACMRCLLETGWINFRMRAMLMSFAAYHLWLHWRPAGLHLARLFVDYEPGIHWSQCQMQSGTTGINTLRIYNPTKQAQDHDPDGVFVRRWIPELAEGAGGSYPQPIVEHAAAVQQARAKLAEFRRRTEVRAGIEQVAEKHGSRKSRKTRPKARASAAEGQMPLFDRE